jgi:arginine exporter protein ArgO
VIATFAWFACLSLLVGRPRVRLFVLSAAPVIDSLMGLILWVIAAQLLS